MVEPKSDILVADAHLPRVEGAQPGSKQSKSSSGRKIIEVAVGVLFGEHDSVLLTTRPEGKVYAHYWEFPGGKLERGETAQMALIRELHEELGIVVDPASIEPLHQILVDYPHALVRLHFCSVRRWTGSLQMREGQHYVWSDLPPSVVPILPGAVPLIELLTNPKNKDAFKDQ